MWSVKLLVGPSPSSKEAYAVELLSLNYTPVSEWPLQESFSQRIRILSYVSKWEERWLARSIAEWKIGAIRRELTRLILI